MAGLASRRVGRAVGTSLARPRSARWLAIALVVGLLPACSSDDKPPGTDARQPNIVFLLTDDMALPELAEMPHVQELLTAQGVSFERFYISSSLCCPSRATLLRGQYAHNTGVTSNGPIDGGFETFFYNDLESSTLGTWMQDAGYRTGFIGKYMNGYPILTEPAHVPPGWDRWVSGSVGGSPYKQYDYTLNDNGKLTSYGSSPEDYGTDVLIDKSLGFIDAAVEAKDPFFLYLNVLAPHLPATPAPPDLDLFPDAQVARTAAFDEEDVSDKPEWVQRLPRLSDEQVQENDALHRLRLQSLQAVDRGVATLIDELERTGQMDNTYVVFASDNGFHIGQHRLFPGKTTAYEMDIKVPFIVRGPGVPAGVVSDALVGNTDVAPTVAELAGASVPDFVDGRSFASLFRDPDGAWSRQAFLLERLGFTSRFGAADGTTPPGEVPIEPADNIEEATTDGDPLGELPLGRSPLYVGVRTRQYLYVEYDTGDRELYDVDADPEQVDNLAASPAAQPVLDALAAQLERLTTCRAAECQRAEDDG